MAVEQVVDPRAPAMEKGKGLARRWAVELDDASSSASPVVPDPPGFTRSAPDADDAAGARQRKDSEAAWKAQKAWEVAQAPFNNLMMLGFMLWMAGNTVHLFSIGITFSALWQPLNALRSVGKVKLAMRNVRAPPSPGASAAAPADHQGLTLMHGWSEG